MVAPGGPDEKTWAKMSKYSKRIYIGAMITFWTVFLCVLVRKFFIS